MPEEIGERAPGEPRVRLGPDVADPDAQRQGPAGVEHQREGRHERLGQRGVIEPGEEVRGNALPGLPYRLLDLDRLARAHQGHGRGDYAAAHQILQESPHQT